MISNLANELSIFNAEVVNEGWKAELKLDIPQQPIFRKGLDVLAAKGDLLLAICLNNGYYNKENIYRMLRFALVFSNRVQIFFTDGPAQHNYRAMGETEDEIVRKCRLHRNRLRNHCVNGLTRINAIRPEKDQLQVTFLAWQNIYSDSAYIESHRYLKDLYQSNQDFREDIDNTTRRVLEHRLGATENVDDKIPTAIEYVIEELAFILAYSKLSDKAKPVVDHGANGFSYIYYEPWLVFEKLVNGDYDGKVKAEVGFAILNIK